MCTIIDLQEERRRRFPARTVSIEISSHALRAMSAPRSMSQLALMLDDEDSSPATLIERLRFSHRSADVITITLDEST
jgi:hypothetical protein